VLDVTGSAFLGKTAANDWLEINDPNRRRFVWHKRVLFDPALTFGALRIAGWVMHDYELGRGNPVKLPLTKTAKILGVSRQTVVNARDLLVRRGWLLRFNDGSKRTATYLLGPGPVEDNEGSSRLDPQGSSPLDPSLISTNVSSEYNLRLRVND